MMNLINNPVISQDIIALILKVIFLINGDISERYPDFKDTIDVNLIDCVFLLPQTYGINYDQIVSTDSSYLAETADYMLRDYSPEAKVVVARHNLFAYQFPFAFAYFSYYKKRIDIATNRVDILKFPIHHEGKYLGSNFVTVRYRTGETGICKEFADKVGRQTASIIFTLLHEYGHLDYRLKTPDYESVKYNWSNEERAFNEYECDVFAENFIGANIYKLIEY